jgi:hypothetical protein
VVARRKWSKTGKRKAESGEEGLNREEAKKRRSEEARDEGPSVPDFAVVPDSFFSPLSRSFLRVLYRGPRGEDYGLQKIFGLPCQTSFQSTLAG